MNFEEFKKTVEEVKRDNLNIGDIPVSTKALIELYNVLCDLFTEQNKRIEGLEEAFKTSGNEVMKKIEDLKDFTFKKVSDIEERITAIEKACVQIHKPEFGREIPCNCPDCVYGVFTPVKEKVSNIEERIEKLESGMHNCVNAHTFFNDRVEKLEELFKDHHSMHCQEQKANETIDKTLIERTNADHERLNELEKFNICGWEERLSKGLAEIHRVVVKIDELENGIGCIDWNRILERIRHLEEPKELSERVCKCGHHDYEHLFAKEGKCGMTVSRIEKLERIFTEQNKRIERLEAKPFTNLQETVDADREMLLKRIEKLERDVQNNREFNAGKLPLGSTTNPTTLEFLEEHEKNCSCKPYNSALRELNKQVSDLIASKVEEQLKRQIIKTPDFETCQKDTKYDKDNKYPQYIEPEHECECGRIIPSHVITIVPEGTSLKEALQGYPDNAEGFSLKGKEVHPTIMSSKMFTCATAELLKHSLMYRVEDVQKAGAEIIRRIRDYNNHLRKSNALWNMDKDAINDVWEENAIQIVKNVLGSEKDGK